MPLFRLSVCGILLQKSEHTKTEALLFFPKRADHPFLEQAVLQMAGFESGH